MLPTAVRNNFNSAASLSVNIAVNMRGDCYLLNKLKFSFSEPFHTCSFISVYRNEIFKNKNEPAIPLEMHAKLILMVCILGSFLSRRQSISGQGKGAEPVRGDRGRC